MKIYCSACGHPNAYAATKPKFCNECGLKLGVSKAKATASPVLRAPINVEEGVLDEEEVEIVPQLGGLDVEVEPYQTQGVTLQEIVDSNGDIPDNESVASKPKRSKKTSKKVQDKARQKFLQDWQKEAGAIRRKQT